MSNAKLNNMLLSALFSVSASGPASAKPPSYTFQPDAIVMIGGQAVPVDLALLGDHGEETTGFYASLDTDHGAAFSPGWQATYAPFLTEGLRNTNLARVTQVKTHLQVHGMGIAPFEEAYHKAKQVWDAHPELRANTP